MTTEATSPAEINVGEAMSLALRIPVKEMGTAKSEAAINFMKTTINNKAQYLKRRYNFIFESNLVDAVTTDRQHVVVTFIATRVK